VAAVIWWRLIPGPIRRGVSWLLGVTVLLWLWWREMKRNQALSATMKAKDADYENADDIRRRVSTDRAKRVRELDDAGWRD
jgi:hypothetical protein